MKVCSIHGCPILFKSTTSTRCPKHRQQYERARGSRQQRGYDTNHDQLRQQWAPKVRTGRVACARCRERITPDEPWDLGHDDDDRAKYSGPEHRKCNRSAGGRSSHPTWTGS